MESLIQQKNGAQSAPATQRVITRQMAFAPPQTTQAMIPPTTFSNNASTINHSFPNSKFRVLRITLCFGFEKFVVNRMVIVSCWWKMSRVAVGLCAPLIWSGRSTVGPVPLKHQTMDRHHPRLPHAGLAQRQSGALVQRRSRFRNSHPAPEGDHAGRPGASLNRGSIPQPEGSTPSGAGATEYAAFLSDVYLVEV